jgi:hypothetical protein
MTFQQLVALRKRGERPEVLVLSLVGRIRGLNYPVLVLDASVDLRYLAGMTVYLAHAGDNVDRIIDLCDQIMLAEVENLETWNVLTGQWLIIIAESRQVICRGVPDPCVSSKMI